MGAYSEQLPVPGVGKGMLSYRFFGMILGLGCLCLMGCEGTRPDNLGVQNGKLAACPASPNCVSSHAEETDADHYIAPIRYEGSREASWEAMLAALESLPRNKIISKDSPYLYLEFKTRFGGFVDDVEIWWPSEEGRIDVRSASRKGYSDFGANRSRVEEIRKAFRSEMAKIN